MPDEVMTNLEQFLSDVKKLEKQILTLVLSSFLFSLLLAAVRYDSGNFSSSAMIELLGGCMGAAGILSAFFGSYIHPAEKHEILDYRPILAGLRVIALMSLSAICFYLFYFFSRSSDHLSLFFAGVGTFLFFRTVSGFVVTIRHIELQKAIWDLMTPEMRAAFYQRHWHLQKTAEYLESVREHNKEITDKLQDARSNLAQMKHRDRLARWKSRFAMVAVRLLRIRRRIGGKRLLTRRERLEESMMEQEWKIVIGLEGRLISEILSGEKTTSLLEGANVRVYNHGPWLFAVIDGKVDQNIAQGYAAKLKSIGGTMRKIFAIVAPSADVTFDALQVLRLEGITILNPK